MKSSLVQEKIQTPGTSHWTNMHITYELSLVPYICVDHASNRFMILVIYTCQHMHERVCAHTYTHTQLYIPWLLNKMTWLGRFCFDFLTLKHNLIYFYSSTLSAKTALISLRKLEHFIESISWRVVLLLFLRLICEHIYLYWLRFTYVTS